MNMFNDFNFEQLNSPDFKEDAVREVLILPLLYALGYTEAHIVRSKSLQHPFLKIGSKKRPITLIPDYLLKIDVNTYTPNPLQLWIGGGGGRFHITGN